MTITLPYFALPPSLSYIHTLFPFKSLLPTLSVWVLQIKLMSEAKKKKAQKGMGWMNMQMNQMEKQNRNRMDENGMRGWEEGINSRPLVSVCYKGSIDSRPWEEMVQLESALTRPSCVWHLKLLNMPMCAFYTQNCPWLSTEMNKWTTRCGCVCSLY